MRHRHLHLCARFGLTALAAATLCAAAPAQAQEFGVASAGGVTLDLDGSDQTWLDADTLEVTGDISVGVGSIRTTLAGAVVRLGFVDGEVDTLAGTAGLMPGAGIFGVVEFGQIQGTVGLSYGDEIPTDAPLRADTRYIFVNVAAGPSVSVGDFEFALGSDTTVAFDPSDPAFFSAGTVSPPPGLDRFVPCSEGIIGVSAHGRIPLAAEHTWGLDDVETSMHGHLLLGVNCAVPNTPISVDGLWLIDADPEDIGTTFFEGGTGAGVMFNGRLSVALDLSGLPLGDLGLFEASGRATFTDDGFELWYSGTGELNLADLGLPFDAATRTSQRFAGYISDDLSRTSVELGLEARIAGWNLADGTLRVTGDDVRFDARVDLHVARAQVEGYVDGGGFEFTGSAAVNVPLKVPEQVTGWIGDWIGVDVPMIDFGRLGGRFDVTVTDDGLHAVPHLEFCAPFGGGCASFDPARLDITPAGITMCGSLPSVGHMCFEMCDTGLCGAGRLFDGGMLADFVATIESLAANITRLIVPVGVPRKLTAPNGLALRSRVQGWGADVILDHCPDADADPRCHWVFEPSTTRHGHFYVRNVGTDLCLHMHGGNVEGAYGTLRPCDQAADRHNLQYRISTGEDYLMLRMAEGPRHLTHAGHLSEVGTKARARSILDGSLMDWFTGLWGLGPAPAAVVPMHTPVQVVSPFTLEPWTLPPQALLSLRMSGGWNGHDAGRLDPCAPGAFDPTCNWIFEPSDDHPNHVYLRRQGTDLCLAGGLGDSLGSPTVLIPCESARGNDDAQFAVRPSPTREGLVYLKLYGVERYLHAHGGVSDGAMITLHTCPRENDHPNCQWGLAARPAADVPTEVPVYLRGGDLAVHLHGGAQVQGAAATLTDCPEHMDHADCQWLFEPSPTRRDHYYVRSRGTDLCLHAQGGANVGARGTLWPCDKAADRPDLQFLVQASPSQPDEVILQAAGTTAAFAALGDAAGSPIELYPVEVDPQHPAFRWRIRVAAPTLARQTTRIRGSEGDLWVWANDQTLVAPETLADCAADDPACDWVFEPSPTRAGAYYLRSRDTDLCLHAHGGAAWGAEATLWPCDTAADHDHLQFEVHPSPSRPGMVYLKVSGHPLYLHAHGGIFDGASITLHGCPMENDHPNCQWDIGGGAAPGQAEPDSAQDALQDALDALWP